MANIAFNRLTFEGDENELGRLRDLFRDDETGKFVIDFNKVKKQPEELNDVMDMGWGHQVYLLLWGAIPCNSEQFEMLYDAFQSLSVGKQLAAVSLALKFRHNELRYGSCTANEWCRDNWGTGNTYNPSDNRNNEREFYFETAWCSPQQLVLTLSQKFPTVRFTVEWADEFEEDLAYRYTVLNGALLTDEELKGEEAEKLINQIGPYD